MLVSPEASTLAQYYVDYIKRHPKAVIVVGTVISKCYKDFLKNCVTGPTKHFGMLIKGHHTSYYISLFGFNNENHLCLVSVYNVIMSYSRYLPFRVKTCKPLFKKCSKDASVQWFTHTTPSVLESCRCFLIHGSLLSFSPCTSLPPEHSKLNTTAGETTLEIRMELI